jgi:hypothetical protein
MVGKVKTCPLSLPDGSLRDRVTFHWPFFSCENFYSFVQHTGSYSDGRKRKGLSIPNFASENFQWSSAAESTRAESSESISTHRNNTGPYSTVLEHVQSARCWKNVETPIFYIIAPADIVTS